MVRIQVKGGIWKNTEDEILKAAVMKYGFNQWARISSLLVRKSAKQCKARWAEWLSPNIRKVEWSREEEERLLHLAKVMPTQWRTIAPLLNRTATQCLEHYEQLLDQAQRRDESSSSSSSSSSAAGQRDPRDDPRRLRPGEIDPLPESKPARPDAVDMDEDEKEMLSEARARLANTKGKKAKRKAREKQLEEARRLAVVQKSREMLAAGLEVRARGVKRREIDYNLEVPFERRPPPGFFSTQQEDDKAREERKAQGFRPVSLEQMEGKRKDAVEEEQRVKDAKRLKLLAAVDLPAVFDDVNRLNDTDMVAKRMQLTLPAPVLREEELEAIAKLSDRQRADERKQAIEASTSHPSTRGLLTPSFPTPHISSRATPLITAQRTPMAQDLVSREAENLLRLVNAQTPLLGGENAALHPSDFSRATPQRQLITTPKPVTPLIGASPSTAAAPATPASLHANPQAPSTPSRDGAASTALAAPLPTSTSMTAAEALTAQSARSAAREEKQRKSHLKQLLSMLPAPKNEFALSAEVLGAAGGEDDDGGTKMEEDREDIERREEREEKQRREAEWRRESQAVQKHLPRPRVLPSAPPAAVDAADGLVVEELRALLERDAARHPLPPAKGRASQPQVGTNGHLKGEPLSQAELDSAKALISAEAPALTETALSSLASSLPRLAADDYLPLPSLSSLYSSLSASHASSASRLSLQLGGYWAVQGKVRVEVLQLEVELAKRRRELECYEGMKRREELGIERRLSEAMTELTAMKDVERQMQWRYRDAMSQQQQQPQRTPHSDGADWNRTPSAPPIVA